MNNMVQVKKVLKYGKYFLFLAIAPMVSFIWPSKNSGQSSILPTVPHAYADVPSYDGGFDGDTDSTGATDCGCDNAADDC